MIVCGDDEDDHYYYYYYDYTETENDDGERVPSVGEVVAEGNQKPSQSILISFRISKITFTYACSNSTGIAMN